MTSVEFSLAKKKFRQQVLEEKPNGKLYSVGSDLITN